MMTQIESLININQIQKQVMGSESIAHEAEGRMGY